MIGLLAIGTSCFALVWVMGRSRVPVPPARMRPFTSRTLWQFGDPPDTTNMFPGRPTLSSWCSTANPHAWTEARAWPGSAGGSTHRQAQVAGYDEALDLARPLADLED